eukprot:712236-Hanusia_phi.AAC.3
MEVLPPPPEALDLAVLGRDGLVEQGDFSLKPEQLLLVAPDLRRHRLAPDVVEGNLTHDLVLSDDQTSL